MTGKIYKTALTVFSMLILFLIGMTAIIAPSSYASANTGDFTTPTLYSGLKITPDLQPTGSRPEITMSNDTAYGEWRDYDSNTRTQYQSQGFWDDPNESKFLMEVKDQDDTVDITWKQIGTYYGDPIGVKVHIGFDDIENIKGGTSPFTYGDDETRKIEHSLVIPNMFCDLYYIRSADPAKYTMQFFFTDDESETPIDIDLAYFTFRDLDGIPSSNRYQSVVPLEGWTGEAYKVDGSHIEKIDNSDGTFAYRGTMSADGTADPNTIAVCLSFSGTSLSFEMRDDASDNVYKFEFNPIVEPTDVPIRFVLDGDVANPVATLTMKSDSDFSITNPSVTQATNASKALKPTSEFHGWYLDPEYTIPFIGTTHIQNTPLVLYAYTKTATGTKTITKTGPDEYQLNLSVEGDDWSEKNPTDILFVVDATGSMGPTYQGSWKIMSEAIKTAGTRLLNANAGAMRIGVGAFSNNSWKGKNYFIELTDNPDWNAFNNVAVSGSTSWFEACDLTEFMLQTASETNDTYVVFISDGAPNLSEDGGAQDDGRREEFTQAASDRFNDILNANDNVTLVVASIGNLSMMEKVANDTDSTYLYGNNAEEMSQKLESLLAAKTLSGSAQNATISDTLSQWVTPLSTDSQGRPSITVDIDGNQAVEDTDYSYEYDKTSRTLTVTDLHELGGQHHMNVHIPIRPADSAYSDHASNSYPNRGEAGTGDISKGVDGYFTNSNATVSWDNPITGESTSSILPKPVMTLSQPHITLTKEAISKNSSYSPGDTVKFNITVTNDGGLVLNSVAITDKLQGTRLENISFPSAQGTLAPGESATATAVYTIKQSDIEKGIIENTATVTAISQYGKIQVSDNDDAEITITPSPSMTLIKQASDVDASNAAVGSKVKYTFTIRNTGNTSINGIKIDDAMISATSIQPMKTTLLPGESTTASVYYLLTQEDIDTGSIHNTAIVTGTPVADSWNKGSIGDTAESTITIAQNAGVSVSKTADANELPSTTKSGTKIKYHITVTNTGNVTLDAMTLSDQLIGSSAGEKFAEALGSDKRISPGEKVAIDLVYSIKQTDIDEGTVINNVSVSGEAPDGSTVSDHDEATTTIDGNASLSISKEVIGNVEISKASAGTTVGFLLTATNTGNVTLKGVHLVDLLDGATFVEPDGSEIGTMLPGDSATAIVNYVLTQEDIDNGNVTNVAQALGTSPDGETDGVVSKDSATVEIAREPDVLIEKTVDIDELVDANPGDVLTYTITVFNTGNTTLKNLIVNDDLLGGDITQAFGNMSETGLEPGMFMKAEIEYTVTQRDIETGQITNVADVEAIAPDGSAHQSQSEAVTAVSSTPKIELLKEALIDGQPVNPDAASLLELDDNITYRFTITNTGSSTLNDLVLNDEMLGGDIDINDAEMYESGSNEANEAGPDENNNDDQISKTYEESNGKLLPGQSLVISVPYTVTQTDIDNGVIDNIANVEADVYCLNPSKDQVMKVSDDDEAIIELSGNASISLSKVAIPSDAVYGAHVSDKITWYITAENDGDITLNNVNIVDMLSGATITNGKFISINETGNKSESVISEDSIKANQYTLSPGDIIELQVEYQINENDISVGYVNNIAQVTGNSARDDKEINAEAQSTVSISGENAGVADMFLSQTGSDIKPFIVATLISMACAYSIMALIIKNRRKCQH